MELFQEGGQNGGCDGTYGSKTIIKVAGQTQDGIRGLTDEECKAKCLADSQCNTCGTEHGWCFFTVIPFDKLTLYSKGVPGLKCWKKAST